PVSAALPPPGPIVGHVRLHISAELLSHGSAGGGMGWSSSGSPIVQPVVRQ
ncbi:4557_t:CDS:2, partial [Gigaspora rosea]